MKEKSLKNKMMMMLSWRETEQAMGVTAPACLHTHTHARVMYCAVLVQTTLSNSKTNKTFLRYCVTVFGIKQGC